MKKNILIITGSDFPYGAASAKLLRLMGMGLVEKGWRVEVLLQRGRQNAGEKMIDGRSGMESGVLYRFCGWKLRPANMLLKGADTFFGNISTFMMMGVRKIQGRADVALLYNPSGVENALILSLCKLLRIRCVSYISEWYNKQIAYPKWYQQAKWWDFLFRMKAINLWFDGLIMPSHYLHDFYLNKGMKPEQLYILPTLVELPDLSNVEDDLQYPKKAKVRIGFCGKPTRTNGSEDLIRALQQVDGRGDSVELIIIGDRLDTPELLPGLKKLAVELGLEDRVVFTGMVPFARVNCLLSSCDILVLPRPPGTFADAGFPTKLGEYVALRKPVVVTRVGDIPLYLKHKEGAMLAEPGNIDDIAKNINWLIRHPEESASIAENGFRWAKEMLWYRGAATNLDRFLSIVNSRKNEK